MEHDIDSFVLGETTGRIRVDDADSNRAVALAMARQGRRTIELASRQLDPLVYDTPDFIDALKHMVLGSRYARVRILVLQPDAVVTRGHRLLQLAHTLSSFIEVRVPGTDHQDFNEAMLVVDRSAYIHRLLSDRYEGRADFNDPNAVVDLLRRFDTVWEHGEIDPNFRALHL